MITTARGRVAAALALAPLYAFCYAAIKAGLAYAPPLRYGAIRALLGGGTLFVILLALGHAWRLPARLWPGVVGLAVTGTVLAYAAMFAAPGRTGAGIASVLGNTTPLITILLAVPALGERLTPGKWAALGLGLAGAGLIASPAVTDPAHRGPLAVLLPLGAAAGFATASVLVKRLDLAGLELPVAAWQLAIGGGALLAASWWFEPEPIAWSASFVGLVAALGVVGTAATTAAWYWLVAREHDVGRLSLALFAVPVIGLAIGVGVFAERPSATEFLGAGLVLAALAVLLWRPHAHHPPPEAHDGR